MKDEFTTEPQPDDPLQLAGDAALKAITAALDEHGIDENDFSAVISLGHGEDLATIVHAPHTEEENFAVIAFEIQLMHAVFSAKALGLSLNVINVGQG